MFFESEQLNISHIHNVVLFAPKDHAQYTFPGKLPTYELMYFLKGDITIRFHGKIFHLHPGDLLYLPKGIDNNDYTFFVKEEFALYNIYFDTPAPLTKEAIQIQTDVSVIKTCYEKIYRTWLGKRSGYYYESMQLVYKIFELLHRAQVRYSPNSKLSYLAPAEEYIAEHYCDANFNYEALVLLTGLSYSYFKKLFIDKYSVPPVKHITRLKIQRACELLQTKKFSISEVAKLCGFENVYYFSNVFKKQMGTSPKNYNVF